MQETLIIFKPDCMEKGLVGKILARFEDKGFMLRGMKMVWMDDEMARGHYAEHEGKDFFEDLIRFITRSPVIVAVLTGTNVIPVVRRMVGCTDSSKAAPGTIRGDYGLDNRENIIHASDSPESAQKEITYFFKSDELHDYGLAGKLYEYTQV